MGTALGIGLGLPFVQAAPTLLSKLLAMGHEALWLPGNGETQVLGRVSSAPDLSGHGYTITQADAAKRPLVAGNAWQFRLARNDFLRSAAPVALGVAAYTVWYVASAPNVAVGNARLWENGVLGSNGQQSYFTVGGTTALISHYAPGLVVAPTVSMGTGSVVATVSRWSGGVVDGKVGATAWGPAALAAAVAASGAFTMGSRSDGAGGADIDILGMGFLARSITDPEMATLKAALLAGLGAA